jgi:hypothetical protein
MLGLKCDRCGGSLTEPGALVFSPPMSERWLVEKYHVCADCWPHVAALLRMPRESVRPSIQSR